MNKLDAADLNELFNMIDGLLISMGFSSLIFGIMLGFYFSSRYEGYLLRKRGGDYCPLCNQSKGQGV